MGQLRLRLESVLAGVLRSSVERRHRSAAGESFFLLAKFLGIALQVVALLGVVLDDRGGANGIVAPLLLELLLVELKDEFVEGLVLPVSELALADGVLLFLHEIK